MSNRLRRPSFAVVRAFALIAIAAVTLFTITAATNAAGFSFINSVSAFFGLQNVSTELGASPVAPGDVSIAAFGVPYTQNFNTLPSSGSATWTNDSTIAGWFHARTGTGTTIVAN